MELVSITYAKANFSTLLRWVEQGEKIAITRRGKIIAYLVPEQKSKLSVADYFNSPERPTEDFMQEWGILQFSERDSFE